MNKTEKTLGGLQKVLDQLISYYLSKNVSNVDTIYAANRFKGALEYLYGTLDCRYEILIFQVSKDFVDTGLFRMKVTGGHFTNFNYDWESMDIISLGPVE